MISTQAAARCKVERRRDRPADGALPATREPPPRRRGRRRAAARRRRAPTVVPVLLAFEWVPARVVGRLLGRAQLGRDARRRRRAPRRRVGGPRRLGSEEQGQARRGRLRPRRDRRAALRPPRPVGRARRPRARAGVERRGDSTPSTRRCPSGRVGSMAWRLTKVHRNISHWLISTQAGEPAPPGPRPGPVAAGAFAARRRDGLPRGRRIKGAGGSCTT